MARKQKTSDDVGTIQPTPPIAPDSLAKIRVEYWPISRLKPYKNNPRKNDHAVPQMQESILKFGFTVPVLARSSSGEICDGHLRTKAAIALGYTEVPVIPCDDWSDAQIKSFRILANRSQTWGSFDTDLLRTELLDLKGFDFDLKLTGFDSSEIDSLLAGKGLDKPPAKTRNASAPKSANMPVISYNIVFDDEEGQKAFFEFLKRIRTTYPDLPTAGARIAQYCRDNAPSR